MHIESGSEIMQAGGRNAAARLSTTALPLERIGRKAFEARFAIVEALHVTYQQKNHVFGYIAPTVGGTWAGYGTVYGGGGSISSRNESVVQVVYCDAHGCENTVELPASISAREGSILRLDHLNGILFAAQNVGGRQEARPLLGPDSFVPWFAWTRGMTVLSLAAAGFAAAHIWLGALIFAASPAYTIFRQRQVRRDRKALGNYMGRALAALPA